MQLIASKTAGRKQMSSEAASNFDIKKKDIRKISPFAKQNQ